MPISTVRDCSQLPICMKLDDVSKVLGISRATAFNLAKTPGFPAIRVGSKRLLYQGINSFNGLSEKQKNLLINKRIKYFKKTI